MVDAETTRQAHSLGLEVMDGLHEISCPMEMNQRSRERSQFNRKQILVSFEVFKFHQIFLHSSFFITVKGFEEYFLNLTVENNHRNPWFVEFWETHFECKYPNSSFTPFNRKYKRNCTKNEKLSKNNTDFEDQLNFVSDAVMAFAVAFR